MLLQIYGHKNLALIPEFQVTYLYNDLGVFIAAQFPNSDPSKYPLMEMFAPVEVNIEPGDAIFIPIG